MTSVSVCPLSPYYSRVNFLKSAAAILFYLAERKNRSNETGGWRSEVWTSENLIKQAKLYIHLPTSM